MEAQRRERGRRVSITPPTHAKSANKPTDQDQIDRRSHLKDLCREDKLKVVDLISQLKTEKDRSRSALAMRKGDQERYVEEYQKLKLKYANLKDDYALLQQKYEQSLDLLRQARESQKSAHCSFVVPEDDTHSPPSRRTAARPASTSKRVSAQESCDSSRQTREDHPRKASQEVRDLKSMISCLSKSVRRLNDSVVRTQDPVVSLRLPVSSPPDLNDTAQSGKSVHLQPLNLNVLFEDPDHDERVSKVLARARQTASRVSSLKKTHAANTSPAQQYGDQFYALIQELEQAVAL